MTEPPVRTHVSPGAQLGPYEIEAALGAGGMGEVFRARDTRLHRTVAIKVLPQDRIADPERKRRFLQEARAASALNHPNIVTLHDIASDGGVDFLVMEYVPGKSLDKLMSLKGLPFAEALDYAVQIASALAAAHAAGIVHRDVKPANIIVTQELQVKVLDFGLAKLLEPARGADGETVTREAVLTEPGTVWGTVGYMSPEQTAGRDADHRTDIFSLGVMLYEMLAGRRPFHGKSRVETMHATIHDTQPPLTTVPPETNEILAKALAKEPRDRYQHAGDFGLDLRRLESARKAKSLPSMQAGGASAPAKHTAWAVVSVLLLLGLAAGWWTSRRGEPTSAGNPLENATFSRLTDFEGAELAAEISPDGKFVAFLSDRDNPFDIWLTQVGSGRFLNLTQGKEGDVLEVTRSTGFSGDGSQIWLRGGLNLANPLLAPIRLMPLMGGPPRPFVQGVSMSWSPDGGRIAYHTGAPGDPTFIADRIGANPKQIFVDPNPGWHCHYHIWSPDGRWIYFVRGNVATNEMDLWRIAPSGGEPERLTSHNRNVAYPAPIDARTVLYVSPAEDGSGPWLWAVDVERRVSRRVTFGLEQYRSVAASLDGRRIVASVSNPSASLWTVPIADQPAQEQDVKPFPVPNVRAAAPRFGMGSLFFLSSRAGGDGLWRYRDDQALEIWKGSDGALLEPAAISPDGKRVAILLRRQGKIRLHVMSDDGAGLTAVGETVDARGSASWSPDGKWIVFGGVDAKGAGLFKIAVEGGAPIRLSDQAGFNPVWSPNDRLIVYSGAVQARFQPLLAVRPDGGAVPLPPLRVRSLGERVRFLPDGKGLVYMEGGGRLQDFWLLDTITMKIRPLTRLENRGVMRTFDITADGKQIVFDRLLENSDIVLIDLPTSPTP